MSPRTAKLIRGRSLVEGKGQDDYLLSSEDVFTKELHMKSKEQRKAEAEARAEKYSEMSSQLKTMALDRTFGPGKGAGRERARLLKLIETSKPPAKAGVVEVSKKTS